MVEQKKEECECVKLIELSARLLAGRKRDALSVVELEVVKMLETYGYLLIPKPANGFVGKVK